MVAHPDDPTGTFAQHLPFARLLEQRIVFLRGALVEQVADEVVAQLLALDAQSGDDVHLYIDSPGGDVGCMLAIYDTMEMMSAAVNTRCIGIAASAGAFILAGGTGTRSATRNSRILIHQPLGHIPPHRAVDLEIQVEEFTYMRRRMEEVLSERTGQPLERIQADTDRDFWMSAEEAKAYGLIDEVVPESGRRRLRRVPG